MNKVLFFLLFSITLFLKIITYAQPTTASFLSAILATNNNPVFREVLANRVTYRCQIIYTQINRAYGFLTDVSYIIDFKSNVEFMLAATVYVNSDNILNDGKYDYDNIGYPFLYQLGQTIYNYELRRKHIYKKDLSKFKLKYEHRDPNDKRPSIKIVDN